MERIETFLVTDEQEVKRRKCRSIMRATGTAVVLFAAWNMLKCIMDFLLETELSRYVKDTYNTSYEKEVFTSVMLIVVLIDVLIRMYVGRKIIKETNSPPEIIVTKKGKKRVKGRRRLNVAIAFLMLESFMGISNIAGGEIEGFSRLDIIVSSFIDLTMLIILIRMVYATVQYRKFTNT